MSNFRCLPSRVARGFGTIKIDLNLRGPDHKRPEDSPNTLTVKYFEKHVFIQEFLETQHFEIIEHQRRKDLHWRHKLRALQKVCFNSKP
jgi:hypothetical protein